MARGVAIVGSSVGAAQAALTLAELGVEVKMITPSASLTLGSAAGNDRITSSEEQLSAWPLLLQAANHPRITLHTNAEVEAVTGRQGRFAIRATRHPRYVREDLCTACGRCEQACSVQVPLLLDGRRVPYSAIHAPVLNSRNTPSAYLIEKKGVAPCRASCPLGINVQGFVSLLSKGKTDAALRLINEAAPLAGVLGRVCTHPCEDSCKRSEVDSPVFIRALHRYAADSATSGIEYQRKAPEGSKREKIAIVGSGPAGLTAAWELARRGYWPTLFESHAVVGGMLATGIPRFRLPHEVREREVEAIRALGVDIKTGVTVGRDVTISDLRERKYRAFFLAIGAHQNRRLDIPGEHLEGVVDAMSLLFALNLKVGASVGSNIVVIGGGNSAVDSARTANRRGRGSVRILYRRTKEEMTAVPEDLEDAINEGISIEYLTTPIEILADDGGVTGIRCQLMRMGAVDADGRRKPEPVPGSEFVLDADHVVVAIGQNPNSSALNIRWLDIDEKNATISADPLTLETRIPGIFAGGDCVTGSATVVDAAAAGLRAAESIDRYLRGRNLRKGRTLEKPEAVAVDINERDISYYRRARMPGIAISRRMGNFEETTLGLPPEIAEREASRCLNCALCSECRECERVCELNAVVHRDSSEPLHIAAEAVVSFPSGDSAAENTRMERERSKFIGLDASRTGIYAVQVDDYESMDIELARATAIALQVAAELKPRDETPAEDPGTAVRTSPGDDREQVTGQTAEAGRIGVVLCRCGGSISSVIDFDQLTNGVLHLPAVCTVQEVSQVCSEEGAQKIATLAAEWKLDRLVVAACRCCGLDQICFSCTDRRVICQQHLSHSLPAGYDQNIEFVNIREQCAWIHEDDPEGATRKAKRIVASGIARARWPRIARGEAHPLAESALVLGAGVRGLMAAREVASQGYVVAVVSGPQSQAGEDDTSAESAAQRKALIGDLEERGIHVRPWPQELELSGSPGSYEAVLRYDSQTSRVGAGAVILDLGKMAGEVALDDNTITPQSLLGRVLARRGYSIASGAEDHSSLRESTIKETAGIFIMSPNGQAPADEQVLAGAMAAGRAAAYLSQGVVRPRSIAVSIDSKLCRGCGDCAAVCPFIEMRERSTGVACAYVDPALCLGCGACISHCPTGAITQPLQSTEQVMSALEALFKPETAALEPTSVEAA